MRDGFVKVAAGTPKIKVADCRHNAEQIFTLMREAGRQGVRVLALPELCLTGYTCGDLVLQDVLLKGAEEGLATILEATKNLTQTDGMESCSKETWFPSLGFHVSLAGPWVGWKECGEPG